MKKIFTFLLFLISLSSVANDARWQEGEIVFQISKSSQQNYTQKISSCQPYFMYILKLQNRLIEYRKNKKPP